MKRRAAALATLSIASFLALAYWAVSNTSKPAGQTEMSAALHTSGPAHTTETLPTPDPLHAAAAAIAAQRTEPTAIAAEPAPVAAIAPAAPGNAAPQATPLAAAATPAAQTDAPSKEEQPELAAAATAKTEPEAAPAKIVAAANDTHKTEAPVTPSQPSAAAAPTPAVSAAHAAATEARKEPVVPHSRNPLLVVRALPEGSVHLWLDGQRMANPFDVRLPRDSKHRIDARGEGYETSGQTVRLEADAKLTFALRRAAVVPAPRSLSNTPSNRPSNTPAPRDEHAKASDKPHRGAGFVSVSPY